MTQEDEIGINMVISQADSMWGELREYNKDIINYLADGTFNENTNNLLNIALKLIISELLTHGKDYEKYPIQKYTTDDFIKMAIINPVDKDIDYDNQEECEKFIGEVRAIMWGYIRQYYEDLTKLFMSLCKDDKEDINEDEFSRLIECLCVAYIETNFRRRELYFLERGMQ